MTLRSPWPDADIPPLALTDFVLGDLGRRAERTALIDGPSGHEVTYRELADAVTATAGALQRRGVRHGDVIAVRSRNNWQYAAAVHGALRAGATVTLLSPGATEAETTRQLKHSGARLLFTESTLLEGSAPLWDTQGWDAADVLVLDGEPDTGTPHASLADLVARGTEPTAVPIDPDRDVALLPYSSGTSGPSKGVMLTHRNLVANMVQTQRFMTRLGPQSRTLALMPFFHIYGMQIVLNQSLQAGASIVTMPQFEFTEFLEMIGKYRVDRLPVAPPILVMLAKDPIVDGYDLSSVRYLSSGAAPLDDEVVDLVKQRLGCHVRQGYGMTELSPAAHAVPDHRSDIDAGAVGFMVPNMECRVVDLDTGRDVGPGEWGELWCRGPNVMKGYLNDADATARTVDSEGFLHTGDVVAYDDEGSFTVVDRVKELIKYKGHQVPPAELESVLLGHEGVADAAVVGVPDQLAGELPKAFVVRGPAGAELDEQAVMAHVAAHVPPYQRVRLVEFVDAIPKSPSGKLLRNALRERL
ncbi:AMP-binding protein [Streptomyces sp. NBC_00059]|uniref:AMP-binding protein n=1 Tax=Streptomyces sp. NBC_00059 TaxID=2975635 RepID=UPI00224D86F5|nr:AMP-binding protein [Streptomyces sp. NBC_00059]MCX5415799.1 AMP-binding protein [Streptomyces sp. NBC_00059]